jgi:hypothetical protein
VASAAVGAAAAVDVIGPAVVATAAVALAGADAGLSALRSGHTIQSVIAIRTSAPAPSNRSSISPLIVSCWRSRRQRIGQNVRRVQEQLGWALALAFGGWCAGAAIAWLTAWAESTPEKSDLEASKTEKRAWRPGWPGWRRLLVPDPRVQAVCALLWAVAAFTLPGEPTRWAMVGLLAVPLVQVAFTDFRTRYVYTLVAGVGIALGLAFGWQVHNSPWWTSIAGALGAYAAFAVFYLLAALIYRSRVALFGGDLTIAAMIGAGAAVCTPQALITGTLIGAGLGLVYLVVKRSRHAYMPYGPGLCLGGLLALFFC